MVFEGILLFFLLLLQDETFPLTALPTAAVLLAQQCRAGRVLEYLSDAVVGFGRAFEVVSCADLLLHFFALLSVGV